MISSIGKEGVELAKELLRFDPKARLSAIKVSSQHLQLANSQSLHHRFFTVLPRPTAPKNLPKPLAELRPRQLAPDETKGKPKLSDSENGSMKRRAESPGELGLDGRRVARKLFA
jgi:cyclin-dependent kinase 7